MVRAEPGSWHCTITEFEQWSGSYEAPWQQSTRRRSVFLVRFSTKSFDHGDVNQRVRNRLLLNMLGRKRGAEEVRRYVATCVSLRDPGGPRLPAFEATIADSARFDSTPTQSPTLVQLTTGR